MKNSSQSMEFLAGKNVSGFTLFKKGEVTILPFFFNNIIYANV
jgi:hypothetical protein